MQLMYFTNNNMINFLRDLNQLPTYVRAWEIKPLLCSADLLRCYVLRHGKKSDLNIHIFNIKSYRMPRYIQKYNIQLFEKILFEIQE